jgi:hypothetical protein
MFRRFLIPLLATLVLGACATAPGDPPIRDRIKLPDTLPDTLGDQGLLVGVIAADGVANSLFERYAFSRADVQIDDIIYTNAVRNNYLVLPLPPGDHVLEALHIYRSADDRTTIRYPLKNKFRIASGQATNMGVILLVTRRLNENARTDGKYWRILVDNTADMGAYLHKEYPKLAADLRTAAPVFAHENKFADALWLEGLRRELSRVALSWSEDMQTAQHVGGQVGTIARLLRDTQGKVAAIDVLDTGTTAEMLSCSGDDQRFVCSSAEPALYFVHDSKVEKRSLPAPAKHAWVHTFPPQGLVLIDQNMTVLSSTDNGTTWTKHVWHAPKSPLIPLAPIKFENGKNGYYVYSAIVVDPLAPQVLYREYARPGYRKVPIPNMKSWQRLMETPEGLLIGPQNATSSDDTATLYFRPLGKTEWQARPLPGKRCFYLNRRADKEGTLQISCDGKRLYSTDSARTWTENAASGQ